MDPSTSSEIAAATPSEQGALLDDEELDALVGPTPPPLEDAAGRIRLSFSRIDMYENCPRRFRYAYIDRLPGKPSPALSFGSSVHAALEEFYDRKLPDCPTEDELLDLLYEHWDSSGFEALPRDEQVAYYRHAQQTLRRYHRRIAGEYRLPVTTEAWFELPFDDIAVVVGSIDRVDSDDDGQLHVVDYKTSRRAQPRQRVERSLQLAIYALACEHLFGRLPSTVALDFVVADATVRVPVEDMDLDAVPGRVRAAAESIRAGQFAPTPNRLCDWCDYRPLCPAWPEEHDGDGLGPATARLDELRRRLGREARELRELEAGITRLREEIDQQGEPSTASAAGQAHRSGQPGGEERSGDPQPDDPQPDGSLDES